MTTNTSVSIHLSGLEQPESILCEGEDGLIHERITVNGPGGAGAVHFHATAVIMDAFCEKLMKARSKEHSRHLAEMCDEAHHGGLLPAPGAEQTPTVLRVEPRRVPAGHLVAGDIIDMPGDHLRGLTLISVTPCESPAGGAMVLIGYMSDDHVPCDVRLYVDTHVTLVGHRTLTVHAPTAADMLASSNGAHAAS